MAKSESKDKNSHSGGRSSFITKDTKIIGNFISSENVRVDGLIVGDVSCQKRLIIGKDGAIEGNIDASDITIQGKTKGDVTTKGLVFFASSTEFSGKLNAQKMEVEEGAVINGEITIGAKD